MRYINSRRIITETEVSLFWLDVHHWIRFPSLAALELVRMTTFHAADDGRFSRSKDVSFSVMVARVKAACFRFQLFILSIHFLKIQSMVLQTLKELIKHTRVRITVMTLY